MLAGLIEQQVNAYINGLKEVHDRDQKEKKKIQKMHHQQEREKRLNEAASKSVAQMNTAKRLYEKEEKKQKVLGKLSVIVGANKKGDIVARDGDNIN